MLSASPSMLSRSSLEEMLESLRRREEENENPKDLPPALPARPTSRARRPSVRKPIDFRVGNDDVNANNIPATTPKEDAKRKEKELGCNSGSFGSKKFKKDLNVDSPYYMECKLRDRTSSSKMSSLPSVTEADWEDNIGYFINKKLRVWSRHSNRQWLSGTIQSSKGEEALVLLSDGNVVEVPTSELLPANPELLDGVNDLIQLSYLNEPSVLHNLRFRYLQDKIYSKAGPVLIAVNPFKDIPIFGTDFVTAYKRNLKDSPHVFSVADIAYNGMMREEKNQSIIISGESGAGKTETAKFAMQYLATLGNGSGGMEHEILHSNNILEAFGNAKTSRNNNSSRFGKLIEIHFNALGKIHGAQIQTFLLEKSRVVQLANGERSYHIFYQLCAGASSVLKERLNIKLASEYSYLNQSDCLAIHGADDACKFHTLVEAMDSIQIGKEAQENIFTLLAAILWLGNISFQVVDNENHVEVLDNEALATASRLMGCSCQELKSALSMHKIQAGKDSIAKKLTLQQAIDARDGLSKFVYGGLFHWLLEQINNSLGKGKQQTGRSISILDIYGFESFKKNSFEQFCINYANERLQQHFNRHLFKLEQEEYESEGINWTKVNFEDNEECLNLIEKKPLGILSLLDEESNFPRATDLTFANKLKQHLDASPCFKAQRGRAFGINHYAGEVVYDTNGFLEKNRDPLHTEFIQLLSSCSNPLLQTFASKMVKQSQKQDVPSQSGAGDSQKQSVGTKFKGQLFKLMHHLENTAPHFIRCIKPNSKQLPGTYEEDLVLEQLRCCGVLEVVRISRSGYPTRMTHQDFSGRYGFLLMESMVSKDPLSVSVAVLKQYNVHPELYQIGFTKLFLRAGQISALENRRNRFLQYAIAVQKYFRGHQARRYFFELKNGATALQTLVRVENARRKIHVKYNSTPSERQKAVIQLQSVIRGMLARKQFRDMRDLRKLNLQSPKFKMKHERKISEVKVVPQEQILNLPSNVDELRRRVLKAEAALAKREEENSALREQLQQYEKKWTEYDEKMKSMEEMWQKQMQTLQTSLAAARKTLAADNTTVQPGRIGAISPPYYDSEDATSTISHTTGASTPNIPYILDFGQGRDTNNSALNAVNNLVKELDHRKRAFDDDVKAIEGRSMQSIPNVNPADELKRLKLRFEAWKREYKARLRETRSRIQKIANLEPEKGRRKWWEKIGSKAF